MHREGEEIHVDAQEARAGGRGVFLLKILLFSLAGIVLAYGVIWLIGTASAPNMPEPVLTGAAQ